MTWTAMCQCGWDGPTTVTLHNCPECAGPPSNIYYAALAEGVSADSVRAWLAEFYRRVEPELRAIDDTYFRAAMDELK